MSDDTPLGEDSDRCSYCYETCWNVSATLIRCGNCGVVYGRCNGVWLLDTETIPDLTRQRSE